MRAAWPHLTTPQAAGPFRAFFEIIGLAAAGAAPYDQLAPALLTAWSDWLVERTAGPNPAARRRAALGVIARLDGLLLIRHTLGPAAAEDAARALGIVPAPRR